MNDELLQNSIEELKQKLLLSKDSSEINDIVQLFNMDMKKKEVIRASVFSDLQDSIANQMTQRIADHSDSFSNKDLVEYLKATQTAIQTYNSQDKTIPTIAIQNNLVINDNSAELDKDSRDRVTDLIKNILKQREEIIEPEIVGEQVEVNQETNRNDKWAVFEVPVREQDKT